MENFEFFIPTRVVLGKNIEEKVAEFISLYGKKVLLHYGSNFTKKSGLIDKIGSYLKEAGIEYIEFGGVQSNPRVSLVRKGIKICRENNVEFILAVGGGSVIDSAKAIGIGIPYEGDVWDFYEGKAKVEESIPTGAIVTIPSAGSEASISTVITNEDGWYKKSIYHECICPKFALLNPELTVSLPSFQTSCGIADIMSHVMENYFTSVENADFTDRLCEATLKAVIRSGRIVKEEPENYDARAEIMWTGTFAQMGVLNTGRRGDWASHQIEHELSGIYDVAHGAGMAVVFPAWMKYVYKKNLKRFVQFATRVWDVDTGMYNSDEKVALEGINRLSCFFKEIGLPVNLMDLQIGADRFGEMANKATDDSVIGELEKLSCKDVINILELAYKS